MIKNTELKNKLMTELVKVLNYATNYHTVSPTFILRDKLALPNGDTLSVQYSSLHNCSWHQDDGTLCEESCVEVWFPHENEPFGHVPLSEVIDYMLNCTPELHYEELLRIEMNKIPNAATKKT